MRLSRLSPCAALFVPCLLLACDGTDPAPGQVGPASTCTSDLECDDGLACTVDVCAPDERGKKSFCSWSVAPGHCFVNGVCAADGEQRPSDPCQRCVASLPTLWSAADNGTPCNDKSLCTSDDVCQDGYCAGVALGCNDDDVCTRDACDPAVGCTFMALAGFSCDDGVRCTVDDRCAADASCAGQPDACDDGDPCTVDACNEVEGCSHVPTDGLACDDADACTSGDLCRAGACVGATETHCDDGNLCTIDLCDPLAGCVHLPTESPCCIGVDSVCDDNNPCTDDACDPETGGCMHSANRAACDDFDPCTADDVCADGACVGGAGMACDDGNACTDDLCDSALPGLCLHTPRGRGACDDGLACSKDDRCVDGVCLGDTSGCVCVPDLSTDGVKLTSIQLGTAGVPGEGLDVDQDPATCAPAGCSGGVDNTLSIIAALANDQLAGAVTRGEVLLVIEIGSLAQDPIEVAVFQAVRAPSNASCNVQTQTCEWLVDKSFLDPASCEPVAKIAASLDDNRLVGGGPGTRLPFTIPFNGADLEVIVANLRIEATVTITAGQVSALTGVLGGAVPKQTLIDGLEGLPDDALPISKEQAIGLVEALVENDIDTDQDGAEDAASIGIKLVGRDARIIGVTP